MAYLSKATILTAYSQLSEITSDPNSQGATQFTSALRYTFGLNEFYKLHGRSCNTQQKTDKDEFIRCVGNVVAIHDNVYTANFYNSVKSSPGFAVGSNFFSVNTVKNSLENSTKEFEFPKRSGWPVLFIIKNGNLEEREGLLKGISYYLNSKSNRVAFALWLCRAADLHGSHIGSALRNFLNQRYSTQILEVLLPSNEDVEGLFDIKWCDTPAELVEDDFPKPEQNVEVEETSSLLPPEELTKKVRESFIKFWKLIDQHGVDFNAYISNFENSINPYLIKLGLGYDNIFQVVDYKSYTSIIQRMTNEFPETAYIKNGRQNTGVKYHVGSTHVHYSNYLQVLDNSDFRANIDKEQEEFQQEKLMSLLDQPLQLIYYGAPGTGKSFTIDQVTNEKNSVRTTFHPDSDYASFVGAYKPTMAPMPINAFVGTTVHHAKNAENEKAYEKKIVYKYVPQAFLKAYVEAWKRYSAGEDNPYYLVIEEINRGNCAQIFGDLFQLLDRNNMGCSSYAISADEDIAQFLRDDVKGFALKKTEDVEGLTQQQRDVIASFKLEKDNGEVEEIGSDILDGSKLLLPPNLRIWATMNTSDQSLFPIDSAFKRRWNWEYMPIEYDKKDWTFIIGDKRYSWGEFLKVINPKILELTMSEDKQMGYFFAKPDKKSKEDLKENDTISEKVFVNKVLFYLWTDVFKDYDLTEEPFVYEKEDKSKTPFRFTDFFPVEGNAMLAKFIDGLKLTVVGEETEDADDVTDDGKKVALGKFKVNGGKADTITWSLHQILKPLVGNMSYEQLISKIKEFIPRQDKDVIKVIENPQTYTKEDRWLKHYLTTADGISFVITNQWRKEYIPMVKALADNLGIEFEQI